MQQLIKNEISMHTHTQKQSVELIYPNKG